MSNYAQAALETAATTTDTAQTKIIDAGDDAELLTTSSDDTPERPDDCQCWDADSSLACWNCHQAGFEDPNPQTPGATEGDSA